MYNTYLHLTLNFKTTFSNFSKTQKLIQTSGLKALPNELILKAGLVFSVYTLIYGLTFRLHNPLMWFNHLMVTNLSLYLLIGFHALCILIMSLLVNQIYASKTISPDYFFAILSLNLLLPVLFFSSNIMTFFFVLEVCSCLILFKFVVGQEWGSTIWSKKSQFFNYSAQSRATAYTNVVFFQYWVSFFSSILFVYSMLMFVYFYGSTDWIYLDLLSSLDLTHQPFNLSILIIYVMLWCALLLKLGIAPLHLYKIELYKGLPFLSILFYTVYFFYIFFIFTCLLVTYYLPSLNIVWYNLTIVILLLGVLWVAALLFDVFSLKAFFAYSTIVNSMTFLTLIISL